MCSLNHRGHRALRVILGGLGVLGGYNQMQRDTAAFSLRGERLLTFLRRRNPASRQSTKVYFDHGDLGSLLCDLRLLRGLDLPLPSTPSPCFGTADMQDYHKESSDCATKVQRLMVEGPPEPPARGRLQAASRC